MKIKFDLNQYKILGKKKQKLQQTKDKIEKKPQKPLWFKKNKPEFEELTQDIYNKQDNKDFKITLNRRSYDLKNVKNFGQK